MVPTRTLHYTSALAMIQGLRQLFAEGLRPRGILFIALDTAGDAHMVVPERPGEVNQLKVGHKLSLDWPFEGRMYYLDAVHPIGGDAAVINGDRRLGGLSSMVDVAALVSWFVKEAGDQSVFFGCTPHQPGSWWVRGEEAVPLHQRGFVEIVPAEQGLLARRTMDTGLYFLPNEHAVSGDLDGWQRVYDSPLGNVLMLERRLLFDQLVLSCREGLVELDVYDLPRVNEAGRFTLPGGGYAVVGRIGGGAFAVARGKPMDWGFEALGPATLVGSEGCSFMELRHLITAHADDDTGPFVRVPASELGALVKR
jgi:hypothetical protein